MTTICLIVAVSENNVIGRDGDLPWHISEDLQRFKTLTTGSPVIMGRTTWESLPIKPLPGRRNIVLTRQERYVAEGADVMGSLEEALSKTEEDDGDVFIIGGGNVYAQALDVSVDIADKLFITRVHETVDGDTFFPDVPSDFEIVSQEDVPANDDTPAYSFIDYVRK